MEEGVKTEGADSHLQVKERGLAKVLSPSQPQEEHIP